MFSIIELQTTGGVTAHIFFTKETKNEAMSKFHEILAAAAISNVEYHAAIVLDEEGRFLARECYTHLQAPVSEVND